jgi:malic enzyme
MGASILTAASQQHAESPEPLAAPRGPLMTHHRGHDLINRPLLNKDAAFTDEERDRFGLHGLLPAGVNAIDDQLTLELEHARRKADDLERYIGLAALQDRNETLFYRLLVENLDEFLPIVYTPTVGRACQQFSHVMRRPRGIWITPADIDRIDSILWSAGGAEIRLIVATDNERILGLGDLGAGGMPIPVGKLALYTAAAGIYPTWTLPVSLDVGTDRTELREDPLYLGYRAPRLRGDAYDAFIEAFVRAVQRVLPSAVLQWEDLKQHNALRVLERYRNRLPSFNDDVQGTGAVVLGGLLAARRAQGGLADDRFLFIGAGAAAVGIAGAIRRQLESEGLDAAAIHARLVLIDSRGLVHGDRETLADDQRPFAADPAAYVASGLTEADLADPIAIARVLRPSVLIGTTGCQGAFSEALVREVARHADVPIILPLSNPSERAEALPVDVLDWTAGRALVATGSPSEEVVRGAERHLIGQANNVFVFPGVGLGALVSEARRLDDDVFLAAARELAAHVSADRLARGAIYPPVADLRSVARGIAIAVVRRLRDSGDGRRFADDEIEPAVDRAMWWPEYMPLVED